MFGFYYGDPIIVTLLVLSMIFAFYAQIKVKTTFSKYSKVGNSKNLTGADAAKQVLDLNGVTGVTIERISGSLNDHFDPSTNVIRLSDDVYGKSSVAAIGVAAHEAGHAVQYANDYAPMRVRAAIVPATNIGSTLSMPMILLGFVFSIEGLVTLGILFFSLATVFQLITLPVEFDASKRAMNALSSGSILQNNELKGARKTLSAAAMTYVAALAVSLINLIRIVMLYGRNDD